MSMKKDLETYQFYINRHTEICRESLANRDISTREYGEYARNRVRVSIANIIHYRKEKAKLLWLKKERLRLASEKRKETNRRKKEAQQ